MNKKAVIKKVAKIVKQRLEGESSGHDWWHIYRVWEMAKHIGRKEKADMFVVEVTALLHDIADWKFHNGDDTLGPKIARQILLENNVPENIIRHVCEIISTTSFKGANAKNQVRTLEGKIIQDADRLDAIGAIGIARAFATGAKFDEILHDPNITPSKYKSPKDYVAAKNKKGRTVINHFYEKLLLLKDRMNTQTAKKIAAERHQFMKKYLDRFFREWKGSI